MGVTIRLLGQPAVERDGRSAAGPRGHKAWGLLAYLALAKTAPSRQRLMSLLFAEADNPRRALRWHLAELRRALAGTGTVTVDGDPVVLELARGHKLDVHLLTCRRDPVGVVSLPPGGELLEGMSFADSPAFETWLAGERQRLAAAANGRARVETGAHDLVA